MPKINALILSVLLLAAIVAGGMLQDRRLRAEKWTREATFISIFYSAKIGFEQASFDQGSPPPSDLSALLRLGGLDQSIESEMMKHFPDGLVYRFTPTSFSLEEPKQRPVGLFVSDRLVAIEQNWPIWAKSGERATR